MNHQDFQRAWGAAIAAAVSLCALACNESKAATLYTDALRINLGPEQAPTVGCGNAKVEEGEQCDDGNLNSNDGCSATCVEEALSCDACVALRCKEYRDQCDSPECKAVLACAERTGCAKEVGMTCYCGDTEDVMECQALGRQNGACKVEIEAAAGSSDPAIIAQRFLDGEVSLGVAFGEIECRRVQCSKSCGFE